MIYFICWLYTPHTGHLFQPVGDNILGGSAYNRRNICKAGQKPGQMESPDGLNGLVYEPRATHNMFRDLRLSVKCLERRRPLSYLKVHWKDSEEESSSIGTWNICIPHASGWIHELIHELRYKHRDIIGLSEVRWTSIIEIPTEIGHKIWFSGEE